MKLERVEIENYWAIEKLDLPSDPALSLDPDLTVLHGANGHGKTSVLGAIAAGLGSIPMLLPEVSGVGFLKTDRRGRRPLRVMLRTRDGVMWERRVLGQEGTASRRASTGRRTVKEKTSARADIPNCPRSKPPAPGAEENPFSLATAHHCRIGESHRLSTR